ncbi:hypothetical protein B0T18DRAFT_424013 [Schizothecium vesticola]|uniref:Thioredoxin domain-containing protein n=1 Tax=Schizothecium vesticola TaxID=314040 RepID=A0AA40F9E1_9PEZI|nr:hypothetical protein B0T18DRAFT_424013 [Schizothecium vesticola]
MTTHQPSIAPAPKVGDRAPESDQVYFPNTKPVLLVFLRHCGCPFAEKTFVNLTRFSLEHPEIKCIAVSHSSRPATDKWVVLVGGEWDTTILVDESRALYRKWGLPESSSWLPAGGPLYLVHAYRLGKDEGIWGTGPIEGDATGTRAQMGGAFAMDAGGVVRWAKVCTSADDIPNFDEALRALGPVKAGLAWHEVGLS